MSFRGKFKYSVHFFQSLSLKVMSSVSQLMQPSMCSSVFVHVCVLRVTRHYLQTLFLISHFTRFLSSSGNRKMKKQAAAVDESEIEKWNGVRSQGKRVHVVDGLAPGRLMETNHRGNSTNQQTASNLSQTHAHTEGVHIRSHVRKGTVTYSFSWDLCSWMNTMGFPRLLRGSH